MCLLDNCKWKLYAMKGKSAKIFMIKQFDNKYKCNLDLVHREHEQKTSWVIKDCIKSKFQGIVIYTNSKKCNLT